MARVADSSAPLRLDLASCQQDRQAVLWDTTTHRERNPLFEQGLTNVNAEMSLFIFISSVRHLQLTRQGYTPNCEVDTHHLCSLESHPFKNKRGKNEKEAQNRLDCGCADAGPVARAASLGESWPR